MVKPAPGLFSTMIFWLRNISISAATERASRSVALPGACGTIRRIGLSGKFALRRRACGPSSNAGDEQRRKQPRAQT